MKKYRKGVQQDETQGENHRDMASTTSNFTIPLHWLSRCHPLSNASVRCLEIAECRMHTLLSPLLQAGQSRIRASRILSACPRHLSPMAAGQPQMAIDRSGSCTSPQQGLSGLVSSSTTSFASPEPDPIGFYESARIHSTLSPRVQSSQGSWRVLMKENDWNDCWDFTHAGITQEMGPSHASMLLRWLSLRVFCHQRRLLYGSLGLGTPPSHGG